MNAVTFHFRCLELRVACLTEMNEMKIQLRAANDLAMGTSADNVTTLTTTAIDFEDK